MTAKFEILQKFTCAGYKENEIISDWNLHDRMDRPMLFKIFDLDFRSECEF